MQLPWRRNQSRREVERIRSNPWAMRNKSTNPSLHPPLHGYHDADAGCSWVLLDLYPYIADRRNSTSAAALMSHGEELRVTLCTAPPPLVSYVCVWCPGLAPSEIDRTSLVAAESDLLLIHVALYARPGPGEFFVYKASASKGPSSLRPLPMPRACLALRYNFGLLAHRDVAGAGAGDDGHYYVAALRYETETDETTCFNLWVCNSTDDKWVTLPISLPGDLPYQCTAKVIVLGEQDGKLGFVDPWRGIVICDVLGRTPPRYLPVPKELIRHDRFADEPLLWRDVVLIADRLTIVNVGHLVQPGTYYADCWTWQVSAWSRSVSDEEEDWCRDHEVRSGDILVDDDTDGVWLLPKVRDHEGTMRPTLERLYMAHPMVSLSNSRVVYIMGKVGDEDSKALVLSIDMRKSRLLGVAMFDAERMYDIFTYTCTQSWIPGYFKAGAYA